MCHHVMTTSMPMLSQFFKHIHYISSDFRRHFILDVYGIFPLLRCSISYPRTMSAYDFLLSVSYPFVSMMDSFFSPSIYTLDSIFSTSVPTLDLVPSLFDPTLSIFPTRSLVEGGLICRVYACFHPMIALIKFVNSVLCRALVKKSAIVCSVRQYSIDILLLSALSLLKK